MPNLRVRPRAATGQVHHITPENAGWTYVGFDLWKRSAGEAVSGGLADKEVCLVFVSGKGRVTVDGVDLGELGERMSPFDGPAYAVYAPAGAKWQVGWILSREEDGWRMKR